MLMNPPTPCQIGKAAALKGLAFCLISLSSTRQRQFLPRPTYKGRAVEGGKEEEGTATQTGASGFNWSRSSPRFCNWALSARWSGVALLLACVLSTTTKNIATETGTSRAMPALALSFGVLSVPELSIEVQPGCNSDGTARGALRTRDDRGRRGAVRSSVCPACVLCCI